MCNQVPSVTLQTAVLMQVKEFANNNQQFSVHDITRTIRQKTAAGDLEIPEVEVSGASFRFDIPHAKVKALFDELWRTGVFDPDFTLSRNFNGTYFEYTPSAVNQSAYAGVSVSPTPVTAPVSSPTPTAPTNTASVASGTLPSDIAARVATYLSNCRNRNFRPTLKQVQSAIKRGDASTGYSCPVLRSYITGTLGYTVVDDPEAESRAQVAV
jgi:hypothetical protein